MCLFSDQLTDMKDVLSVLIFVLYAVHALFDHEYAESADLTVFRRKSYIGIVLGKRIVRDTVIDECYRYCGRILFDLDAHGSGTGIRLISIMGDVYEKLFYRYIYLRMNLDRAFEFIDLIVNKCKNLIEIFNQCFNV